MMFSGVSSYGDLYYEKLIGLYAEENGVLTETNKELAE